MISRSLWPSLDILDRQLTDTAAIGILTDADGTLSEIQDHPGLARVSKGMAGALSRLNKVYPLVAVVSGRRACDVQRLVGVKELLYLGNHGLEWRQGETDLSRATDKEALPMTRLLDELGDGLPDAPGLYLEDKSAVIAIHYRQCPDSEAVATARELARRLASKYDLVVQDGRCIIEIRPLQADKGRAVAALVKEYKLKQVIYLGDDATDVDAFKALKDFGRDNVAIAIIGDESSEELKLHADYRVDSIDEVARFFNWLVDRAESRLTFPHR